MGQDAFVERYEKPRNRLQIVIFVAILAVSIFLATQVEKSKDKAAIAAFNNPVPIDSIGIGNSNAQKNIPTLKSPVVNANNINSTENPQNSNASQEYSFEEGPNLENINKLLAAEEPLEETELAKTDNQTTNKLDQVYQQQNDRFLQTLAKSAELETQEPIDIQKLKEAIRSDKPLIPAKEKSTTTEIAKAPASAAAKITDSDQLQVKSHKNEIVSPEQPSVANLQSNSKQNIQKASLKTDINIAAKNKALISIMTKGELDNVISQFARSYNAGDINRLMALFTDNAKTNDQKNKIGIKSDYATLFNNTQKRNLMIKNIKWDVDNEKAEGAAAFVVTVQPKNSVESNLYQGKIKITAVRKSDRVYISRLIHEVKQ